MKNIIYQRKIDGISAIPMPFHKDGAPDLDSFLAHVNRTYDARLTPAINMDTRYANLLTLEQRLSILDLMPAAANRRRFVAGAFVEGETGDLVSLCTGKTDAIQQSGGIPILFQSTALTPPPDVKLNIFQEIMPDLRTEVQTFPFLPRIGTDFH